jgi:hypothetical protein
MFYTYDSQNVISSFGSHVFFGFAEDAKITAEFLSDAWSMQVGVDGKEQVE